MVIGSRAKIVRRYGLAGLFAIAMYCGGAAAQCVIDEAPGTFPTQVGFTPAEPSTGQFFTIDLGPATSRRIGGATASIDGQDVFLNAELVLYGGIPIVQTYSFRYIYGLPDGNYRVHIQLQNLSGPCPEVVVPLVIGPPPPPAPIPTLSSPWWLATLVTGMLAVGLGVRRRRNR